MYLELFQVRINGDAERLNRFDTIIEEKCKEIKGRCNALNTNEDKQNDRVSGHLLFELNVSL